MQSVTLLIDKRRELSTKYKKLLSFEGNNVIVAKNLISAMKTIQDTEPDVIIVSDSIDEDLSEFCKKIRALTYNMRPVIIAVSKSSEIDDRLKVLENGADDFIGEPVNSDEFAVRIKAHIRREYESNLDFKCHLPNLNYSIRALKRVMKTNSDWAAMFITIDNFSNYKKTYTELASDKLLQTFSAIIQSALGHNEYLGVISESEFLVITDIYKAEKIANYLIFAFESVAPKFYSNQDLKRGYVMMRGDEYAGRRCDFMHISIGIVTSGFSNFSDVKHLMNELIQTKSMAHNPLKSNYLIDRPKISAENSVFEKSFNNKISIIEPDESMYLLLKTILQLQGFEIIEGDDIPAVIILDTGEDSINKDHICTLKQKYSETKFIVTSIFHDKEEILSTGVDLYLPKPYELSSLLKWVETFINEFNR